MPEEYQRSTLADLVAGREVPEKLRELRRLYDVRCQLEHLAEERRGVVDAARAAGASWTEVGAVLGVSAQAVAKRYGKG